MSISMYIYVYTFQVSEKENALRAAAEYHERLQEDVEKTKQLLHAEKKLTAEVSILGLGVRVRLGLGLGLGLGVG